jgi:hypothetical protein
LNCNILTLANGMPSTPFLTQSHHPSIVQMSRTMAEIMNYVGSTSSGTTPQLPVQNVLPGMGTRIMYITPRPIIKYGINESDISHMTKK